jgi:hypothetical protein
VPGPSRTRRRDDACGRQDRLGGGRLAHQLGRDPDLLTLGGARDEPVLDDALQCERCPGGELAGYVVDQPRPVAHVHLVAQDAARERCRREDLAAREDGLRLRQLQDLGEGAVGHRLIALVAAELRLKADRPDRERHALKWD